MKFVLKPKHLELKFSFKEICLIIFRGCYKLDRASVHKFSLVLMNIIAEFSKKYGDSIEHGSKTKEELEAPVKESGTE
jgi:hypothetical protein